MIGPAQPIETMELHKGEFKVIVNRRDAHEYLEAGYKPADVPCETESFEDRVKKMKLPELRMLAKEKGLKGITGVKKAELVKFILFDETG